MATPERHFRFADGLTPDQERLVKALRDAVAPEIGNEPHHVAFVTRGTLVRYLRARSWDLHKSTKLLRATLKWRDEYRPDALRWETVGRSIGQGKMQLLLPDRDGRPTVLMRPRLEQVADSKEQIRYLIYVLERASQIADESEHGTMAWLIDFVGFSSRTSPPLSVSMQTLHILQDHYPERLGRAVCFKPPTFFQFLWRAVKPFVDPKTREKLVFISKKEDPKEVIKYFYPEGVDDTMGGTIPIDQLLQLDQYGKKMQALDAEYEQILKQAQEAVAHAHKVGGGV